MKARALEPSRLALGSAIAALFVFPFVAVIARSSALELPPVGEIAMVFSSTAWQAGLSAIFALVLGVIGAMGILSLEGRRARALEILAVMPNAVPVLILLLAVMKIFPWARGVAGIVFVHVLLNAGLLSVALAQAMREKLGGFAELAWVEGASRRRFLARVALPLLKADLALMFFFVFAICFASFAVPLAIGGSRATTVEVLIYEKIRISGDWSEAIGLALLQTLAILAFAWFLRAAKSISLAAREVALPLMQNRFGLAVAIFPCAILLLGLFDGVIDGTRQVLAMAPLIADLPALVAGSIVVGFGAGGCTVLLLLAIAYVRPAGAFRAALSGYAAPSSVLVGFALLIAWRELGLATYFKIALGVALLTVPSFQRFRWDTRLGSLEGQVTTARTLGASAWQIYARVIFPQVIRPAMFLGGLAALWAWGDFALSSVVAERSLTLAMAARGLMDTYRLEAATFLIWLVILGGFATFAVFIGVGRVLGQKPQA